MSISGAPRSRRPLLAVPLAVVIVAAGLAAALLGPRQPSAPQRVLSPERFFLPAQPEGAFADADHGYVLLGRCLADPCETWVGATSDGGRSWHAALVPGLTFPPAAEDRVSHPRATLIVLDAAHAVLESYDTYPFLGPEHRRWRTTDGGETWAQVAVGPIAEVQEVPPGAYVYPAFRELGSHTIEVRIIGLDGGSAVLANAPRPQYAVTSLTTTRTEAPDGSLWVLAGSDTGESRSLYRSTDRGRTWVELPWPDGIPLESQTYELQPGSGQTVYLLLRRGEPHVWRSNDAGMTWEELMLPVDEGSVGAETWAQPDGTLVVARAVPDGQSYRLTYLALAPTASTFEPLDTAPPGVGGTPSFGPEEFEDFRDGPFGVRGMDGSWIPLPFSCRPTGC